jgi:hypothetical protein
MFDNLYAFTYNQERMSDNKPTIEFKDLTALQQCFVSLWDGKIKTTAEKADISYSYARELHAKPYIKKAIATRHKREFNNKIATRQDLQVFWTKTMNDENLNIPDRLKASELIAKSEGMFTEKIHITNPAVEKIDSNRKSRALQIVCFFGDIYQLGSGESADKPPVKRIESAIIDENQVKSGEISSVSPVPNCV